MQEKSRILIFTTSYLPSIGGSELAIWEITKRLPDFEFDIITSRADSQGRYASDRLKEEKIGNVTIHRVGNAFTLSRFLLPKNFFPISGFFKALSLNKKYHYQIIHAYQASQAAGAAWLFKLFHPKVQFILTIQEGKNLASQNWLLKFFRMLLVGRADKMTVISRYLKEFATDINPEVPVILIPNGVDLKKFQPADSKSAESAKVIISVSRLAEKNGLLDLVRAMPLVLKEQPEAKLVIVGKGPLGRQLMELVKKTGLEKSVSMMGEVSHDELPRYLTRAGLFVRASLSEGFGTAFLEAMGCGLAVVGTAVGGITDYLKDGQTGLLCKPNDYKDLAEKIITVLKDNDLRNKLAEAGLKMVRESYSWDNIAARFSAIYHER